MGNDDKGGEDQMVVQRVVTVGGGGQSEVSEGGVEIMAEVYFNDGTNNHGYMLGVDDQLYHYNNPQHRISPYKQTHVHRLATTPHPVDVMLAHSMVEYADVRDDKGERVIEKGAKFGKPVLEDVIDPTPAYKSGTDGQ